MVAERGARRSKEVYVVPTISAPEQLVRVVRSGGSGTSLEPGSLVLKEDSTAQLREMTAGSTADPETEPD
jgi:hypothetical protein